MSKRKVKVEYESPACCNPYMMYGMGGGGGQGGYNYGGMWYIRWIYALLVLIVIVLEFGRREFPFVPRTTNQCGTELAAAKDGNDEIAIAAFGAGFGGYPYNYETIDRSVLFIIVVFLLILCAGCWWGGYNGGTGGYGGGGYGMY